jgi:hypothetical protein
MAWYMGPGGEWARLGGFMFRAGMKWLKRARCGKTRDYLHLVVQEGLKACIIWLESELYKIIAFFLVNDNIYEDI